MSKQTPAKLMRSPSYFNLVQPYVGETHSNCDFTSFSSMYRNYQQNVSWSSVSTPSRRQSSAQSATKETKVIIQNRNSHTLSQAIILPTHAHSIRVYNFNNILCARRRNGIQQQQLQKQDQQQQQQQEILRKEQSAIDGKLRASDSKQTESQQRLQSNNSNNTTTTISPTTTTNITNTKNKHTDSIEIIPLASNSTIFTEVTDGNNVKRNNANASASANAAVVVAVGKGSKISILEKTTQMPTPTPSETHNEVIMQRSFPMFEILPPLITSTSRKQSLLYENFYLLDGIKYEHNVNNNNVNNNINQRQPKNNVNANKNLELYQNNRKSTKLKLDYMKFFKSLTTKPKPSDGEVIFGNAKVLRTNLNGWEHSRINWLLKLEQREDAHHRKHQRTHQRHSNKADANKTVTFRAGNVWDYDENNENVMYICCCLPFTKALLS